MILLRVMKILPSFIRIKIWENFNNEVVRKLLHFLEGDGDQTFFDSSSKKKFVNKFVTRVNSQETFLLHFQEYLLKISSEYDEELKKNSNKI